MQLCARGCHDIRSIGNELASQSELLRSVRLLSRERLNIPGSGFLLCGRVFHRRQQAVHLAGISPEIDNYLPVADDSDRGDYLGLGFHWMTLPLT
ncbi:hypothetical protein [Bremerella sp.]|uniref:hypothetical protein n=1 Tax=Bremerella sp. TaxID=2795602 RepID=UPI00391954BC